MFYNQGYSGYTGPQCETMICTSEPSICKDTRVFTVNDCKDLRILEYCPIMCGRCKPIQSYGNDGCFPLQCLNGAKFNQNTCKCECEITILD